VSLQTAKNHAYDLVICSNVLEHVSYPQRLISDVLQHITSSTILYLEIPHEPLVKRHQDKKQMLFNKRHWHEHINFFCEESIRALADAMNLNILRFQELDIVNEGQPRTVFQISLVRL
jgi:2-polyprenyl-3-methyl-5-hydroxy-6-metoxy-1,4-benzoquinol methylase